MPSILQSVIRSLPKLLFLMVVCLGALALLAVPPITKQLASMVCEDGETITHTTTNQTRAFENRSSIDYYCEGPRSARPVEPGQLILSALTVYVLFFLVVVWPLVIVLQRRGTARSKFMEEHGVPGIARVLSADPTNTTINDNPVVALEMEIVPEGLPSFRKSVKRPIPHILIPRFQPGAEIPVKVDPSGNQKIMMRFDNLAPGGANMGSAAGFSQTVAASNNEGANRLRALKKLREEGLIDGDEYEAKKQDILRDL